MYNRAEVVLYMAGGLIRLLDFASDLWYIFTQDFAEWWLLYLCGLFIALPSIVFFLIFTCIGAGRGSVGGLLGNLMLGLLVAVTEPVGIPLCVFGCLLSTKKSKKVEFYTIEALSRTAGFIEGVFESFPQLLLQSYNNLEVDQWDLFTVSSLGISAAGFLYTCCKLIYAIDKVDQYSTAHNVRIVKKVATMEIEQVNVEGAGEVYNSSISQD